MFTKSNRKQIIQSHDTKTPLEKVADAIKTGKCRKIAIVTGAGTSVSAGIPDFRSKGGMHSALEVEALTATESQRDFLRGNAGNLIDRNLFQENAFPYLESRRPFILGVANEDWDPTLSHALMRLLYDKGVLRRVYTQNVDGLDDRLGIPPSVVVPLHNMRVARCEFCPHDDDNLVEDDNQVGGDVAVERRVSNDNDDERQCHTDPTKTMSAPPVKLENKKRKFLDEMPIQQFSRLVQRNIKDIYGIDEELPEGSVKGPPQSIPISCPRCGKASMKPATTMMGGPLSSEFKEAVAMDFGPGRMKSVTHTADLPPPEDGATETTKHAGDYIDMLIVMGTSLVMYPCGEFPMIVPNGTMNVLLNINAPQQSMFHPENTAFDTLKKEKNISTNNILGPLDDMVLKLVDELGWIGDLIPMKSKLAESSADTLDAHVESLRAKMAAILGPAAAASLFTEQQPPSPATPLTPSIPETFTSSRYTIQYDHLLGSGGFGNVYRALDNKTGAYVAVKQAHVASHGSARHKQVIDEMAQEFEMLKTLVHPNVVQVVDFSVNAASPSASANAPAPPTQIFLELMPNGSVHRIVQDNLFRLHEVTLRRYAHQALKGLAFLHGRGCLHRDIKPGNMLVAVDGTVKLSDFGMSRIQEEGSSFQSNVAGTCAYMAPEVCQGRFSKAGDIWAWGCSILEMATGKPPWHHLPPDQRGSMQLLYRIGSATPPDHMPEIPEHLSCALKAVLVQCFAFAPAERPSAAAILENSYFSITEVDSLEDIEDMGDYEKRRNLQVNGVEDGPLSPTGLYRPTNAAVGGFDGSAYTADSTLMHGTASWGADLEKQKQHQQSQEYVHGSTTTMASTDGLNTTADMTNTTATLDSDTGGGYESSTFDYGGIGRSGTTTATSFDVSPSFMTSATTSVNAMSTETTNNEVTTVSDVSTNIPSMSTDGGKRSSM